MNRICNIYLILFFILITNCFGIGGGDTLPKLSIVISFIGIILIYPWIKKSKLQFNLLVILFCLLISCEILLSWEQYNQSIIDVFTTGIVFFSIVIYYLLIYFYTKVDNKLKIYKLFIFFMTLCSIINIAQYYLVDKVRFLNINYAFIRYGEIRITSNSFYILVSLLVIIRFLFFKSNEVVNKKYLIAAFTINTYYLLFICKTRSFLFIVAFVVISMIIYRYRKNIPAIIISIFLALIVGAFLIKLPIFQNYFSVKISEDLGVKARLKAVDYYMSQLRDTPIFGTGIIKPIIGSNLYKYLRGPKEIFYQEDIGFIGMANQFGIVGACLYIMLIIKMITICRKVKGDKILSIAIISFMLITSINLSVFQNKTMYALPIIIAIIEMENIRQATISKSTEVNKNEY